MALTGERTFVGFGFGAIQAGLFLYEAYCSGNFGRLVVAEVLPERVDAVRRTGGSYALNIAHENGIERAEVGPIEIYDPAVVEDRQQLIAAVAEAEEIATAIPSVNWYVTANPGSLHRILAEGLRRKVCEGDARAVIYAAENHNHAAEILEKAVFDEIPVEEQDEVRAQVQFLNTVIGKMSGVKTDPAELRALDLRPITPDATIAFLVEAFNHILISRIQFDASSFRRGIEAFEEKDDLLPFEEAKLYGHNAVHALAAYLGGLRGHHFIADLRKDDELMALLRAAFIEESGGALTRKYAGVDQLFTLAGYTAYADDLLMRMTNPWLRDTVERVGRDPARKLGWNDRLIGTMRLALSQDVRPERFALGAAAALRRLDISPTATDTEVTALLQDIWRASEPDEIEMEQVLWWVLRAWERLRRYPISAVIDPSKTNWEEKGS